MATPPETAQADYNYLIILLLIGNTGMCLPTKKKVIRHVKGKNPKKKKIVKVGFYE